MRSATRAGGSVPPGEVAHSTLMRRAHRCIAAMALIGWSVALAQPTALAAAGDPAGERERAAGHRQPNVLLIVADDQAWSTFGRTLMPSVYTDLVDRGVLFDRAYDETSECCPSRSEILTGLHEFHTGVDDNFVPLRRPTIVEALHDRGYRTMLAGKYLNSAPCTPRAEFDRWACVGSPPSSYSLTDPDVNIDGHWTSFPGRYQTDVLAGLVTSFVRSTPSRRPFFAMYTPTTPHLPANDDRYAGLPVAPLRPPSYDEETRTDGKPQYVRRPPFEPGEIETVDRNHAVMARAVRSFDDSVGTILGGLGSRARDTLVVYISDNGYLYGEHRLEGKGPPYEESVRVPMIVRYPPITSADAPRTSNALVANIDIAPTIADLAGFHWGADGTSLVPLLAERERAVRGALLLSRCNGISGPCLREPGFWGVETPGAMYIRYGTGEQELYDLHADPYELRNLAGDPAHRGLRNHLVAVLHRLGTPPPVDTTIVSGPGLPTANHLVRFRYFSQSRLATYECRLTRNGTASPWFPCSGQAVTLGPLPPGSYVFSVAATDERGSRDSTPALRRFSIVGPPTGPVIGVRSTSVAEGTGTDHHEAVWRLSLGTPSASPVSVAFDTVQGTARPPADFAARAGRVSFPPGVVTRTVAVPIVPDAIHEPNETLGLRLSAARGGFLLDPWAVATIVDDDPARACTITGTPGPDILGGTAGPDVICGLGGGDILVGRGGDDVLLGEGGNDLLLGGPGDDVLDGGPGTDTASFASAGTTGGVTVSLRSGTASGPGNGKDWFAMRGSVSAVESIEGTPFADTLVGASGANVLMGDGGGDRLLGGAGNDRLLGGAGNDRLLGGAGNDVLGPGPGRDAVVGGTGIDGVTYGDVSTGPVTVDLATGVTTAEGVRDHLSGVENAAGTSRSDLLVGAPGPNTLAGGAGSDRLMGAAGDDVLIGGPGPDRLDGGTGSDTADWAFSPRRESIDLATSPGHADGGEGPDVLVSIEGAVGSSFADALVGGVGSNSLSGGPGNDRVDGGGGTDSLQGGPGNDILDGGEGFDHCFDNQGHDVLRNCETFDVVSPAQLAGLAPQA